MLKRMPMKASRLLSILMVLQARGRVTAASLARTMEVSERTILRDMDQLSAAGVPLWGERGREGGFQLQPGWSTQLTGMTADEAHALLLAGLPGPATELGLGAAAVSARLKLVASLPTPLRDQADRVAERLHVDPVDWYRTHDTPPFLRDVADAVWHARRLRVEYKSWRGTTTRDLEPLGLVLKAGAWYVVASSANRQAPRTYRLSAMLDVSVQTRTFKRPRGFDLAKVWRESTQRFESALRALTARVRVTPRALRWLENESVAVVRVPPDPRRSAHRGARRSSEPTDRHDVLINFESIEHGARQMLGLGAEIEVLEPLELRAEMKRQIGRLRALYLTPSV